LWLASQNGRRFERPQPQSHSVPLRGVTLNDSPQPPVQPPSRSGGSRYERPQLHQKYSPGAKSSM
jgi:hypothetical protein